MKELLVTILTSMLVTTTIVLAYAVVVRRQVRVAKPEPSPAPTRPEPKVPVISELFATIVRRGVKQEDLAQIVKDLTPRRVVKKSLGKVGDHAKGPIIGEHRETDWQEFMETNGGTVLVAYNTSTEEITAYGSRIFDEICLKRHLFLYILADQGDLLMCEVHSHTESGTDEYIGEALMSREHTIRKIKGATVSAEPESSRYLVRFRVGGEAMEVLVYPNTEEEEKVA